MDRHNKLIFNADKEVGQLMHTPEGDSILKAPSDVVDNLTTSAVRSQGWRAERHYDLSQEGHCDINDHRTCEMRVAVGMAMDITQTEGLEPTPGLARIWDDEAASETQLRQALDEWAQRVPDERREEAYGIVEIVQSTGTIAQG